MAFSEMSLLDKAMNLAFYELLGDADLLNHEAELYLKVSQQQIKEVASQIFTKEKATTLYYLAQKN